MTDTPKKNWFSVVLAVTVVLAIVVAIFIGTFAATLIGGIGLGVAWLLRDKSPPAA